MLTHSLVLLHLMFISFFLGGQFYYLFITQPASYKFFSLNDQIYYLKTVLRRQSPILLLILCLVVLTGGFMITPLKAQLGQDYLTGFGNKLIGKLGYFFIVFLVSAYQALAIGFKIKYLDPARCAGGELKQINSVRTQMTVTSLVNIVVTMLAIYHARYE